MQNTLGVNTALQARRFLSVCSDNCREVLISPTAVPFYSVFIRLNVCFYVNVFERSIHRLKPRSFYKLIGFGDSSILSLALFCRWLPLHRDLITDTSCNPLYIAIKVPQSIITVVFVDQVILVF